MSDYASIMMQEQADARRVYNYDPRERFLQTQAPSRMVETFNSTRPSANAVVPESEGEIGSRLDASSVQDAPATRSTKKYIIIDSSQRDWVKQPNPYTNLVVTFGSQSLQATNPIVYGNNSNEATLPIDHWHG